MSYNDTRHKMEVFLKKRKNGKPRELCAIETKLTIWQVNQWYESGKAGVGKDKIYFYETLNAIEEELNRNPYEEDIKEFRKEENIAKRREYLNNIKKGLTREQASKKASINLKLIIRWDTLGKKKIIPFNSFHREYEEVRKLVDERTKRNKQKIKNETVKHIKNGKTLEQAAKLVEKGKYEKTIINWYKAGKSGDKNHVQFYKECQKYLKPPINTNIFAPLPKEWKEHFKKLPMNKTGIAWVNKAGSNWVYARQDNSKTIKISDPNIRNLHKKVIKAGNIWGIRDMTLAKTVINTNQLPRPVKNPPKQTSNKNKVTVRYDRLNEKEFKATVKGTIENNQYQSILNKLKFFEQDLQSTKTRKVKGKIEMTLVYKLNIGLSESFKEKSKQMGWKVIY